MNKQNTWTLVGIVPEWFVLDDPMVSNMYFGFECGDGWFDILYRLFRDLKGMVEPGFQITQVKEKFGELRVYTSIGDDAIWDRIDEATMESRRTCEDCGMPGSLRSNGWMRTQCDICWERRKHD